MRPVVRFILLILIALLLGRLMVVLILRPESRAWFSPNFWHHAAKFGEVISIVNAHYVDADKARYESLSQDALDAMLHGLDRYSDFLDPEEFADFTVSADQHYAGIGVEIERLNRRVTVTDVFENSPAAEAGVEAGDQIVGVDDEDTREFGLRDIVALIRGPVGSDIPVTFFRPAEDKEFTVDITRRNVDYPTVRDVELGPGGIAYLRLSQFSRRSAEELAAALDILESKGMRALILDLRDNPGGLLPVSVAVAGEFLPEGTVVVSTRGRSEGERVEKTDTPPRAGNYPLIVLVNGGSASASEIVSGALQDEGRAVIVGAQTVGKGSVQSIIYLDGAEAVRLTTARYYLPSGRTINEVGVTPDILVELSSEERLRLLAQRAYRDMPEAEFEAKFGVAKMPDRQRAAAEAILRGVLAFEKDTKRGT